MIFVISTGACSSLFFLENGLLQKIGP
uniref:Uncharacterized protein n=1 Tax=Arundo donax TaxID=35708 RepID=A0A0A9DWQ6_ARUDO